MKDIFDPGFFSEEEIELARRVLEGSLERREFIKKAGLWAGGLLLAGSLAPGGEHRIGFAQRDQVGPVGQGCGDLGGQGTLRRR